MKLLIIDNFDSFTYNLQHYAEQFCDEVVVKRNNEIELDEIEAYDAFIISPGPGLPKDSGITLKAIETYASSKKILGVCLGQQAIAEYFGAQLENLGAPLHGIPVLTKLTNKEDVLFEGLPREFNTGRYHSWVVDAKTVDKEVLEITATDQYGQVQALRHKEYNIRCVQFHPESVMTDFGLKMIENWIKKC